MKRLSANWITEDLIDLEYKQFILLAYLDGIGKEFNNKLLYPGLTELVDHYLNLQKTQSEFINLYNNFPEKLRSINMNEFKLHYEKVVQNDDLIKEIEEIIEFSIPQIKNKLEEGKEIYHSIEEKLHFEPIGLIPLWSDEGYLFIETTLPKETKVYEYSMSLYTSSDDTYRSLSTKHIHSVARGPFDTPEKLKLELIKSRDSLPNPATYYFKCESPIPFEEAYFPIAKRMLLKALSKE